MKSHCILLIVVFASVAYGQMLTPQSGRPPVPAVFGGAAGGLGAPNIPNEPFSADSAMQSTHPAPNGEPVHNLSQGRLYRDSQGRTRRETDILSGSGTVGGHNVVITDPIQHVMIVFNANDKVARVFHWQPPVPGVHAPTGAASATSPPQQPWTGQNNNVPTATIQPRPAGSLAFAGGAASSLSVKTDVLGQKEMQGLMVNGTRITRTTASGAAGNSQPIVSTTETWTSPELQVTVLTEINDPRGGLTVMKLTNIQRAEPDAALFQVPPDYTVQETAKK